MNGFETTRTISTVTEITKQVINFSELPDISMSCEMYYFCEYSLRELLWEIFHNFCLLLTYLLFYLINIIFLLSNYLFINFFYLLITY